MLSVGYISLSAIKVNALNIPPGDYDQLLKLKGIDGDLYKRWNMWFNPIIREAPYQFLNIQNIKASRFIYKIGDFFVNKS